MAQDNTQDINFKTSMEFEYGVPGPMSPGVVRVVAPNPSVFTFKGTNTYLVGTASLAVIDPGPDDAEHADAILNAAAGRPITHIFVTHAHRDHVSGTARLKEATGAKVLAALRPEAPRVTAADSPSGKEFIDYAFRPDVPLNDGDRIQGEDWAISALFTPGHAPDHMCFGLEGRRLVFSGDHVMAWNTTVIAPPEGRMSDYVRSLERLLKRRDRLYLPGHGGRIEQPLRMVKAYLVHRRWREQAVLEAIRNGGETIRSLVPAVYRSLDERLFGAAALSVLAHVEHLIERGLVRSEGQPILDHRIYPA